MPSWNDLDRRDDLLDWIDSITQWKIEESGGTDIEHTGDRNMIDLLKMVKDYYYHPSMKGSNSIKDVLPAVLSASDFLKEKYSQPLAFGTNLNGTIFWKIDEITGRLQSPYKLLPPIFNGIDDSIDELILESGQIDEGGAALTAYGKMQFTEMSAEERNLIINGLLRYCELDTLAMLMIYEHWVSLGEYSLNVFPTDETEIGKRGVELSDNDFQLARKKSTQFQKEKSVNKSDVAGEDK